MAPGTWKAPGEDYPVASAIGVAYCSRAQTALTCLGSAEVPHLPAICVVEEGE